ncbi:hypothetical protein P7K49_038114 [Saguinus oedipus]|uniref:Uncharacterized protein n=1 Tax=Saguinus oedipus TaxID=9490 RepID=A0ABQ9TDQ9_SAGOE|nr:hypothetical protein P7K49_038114 [Saguinus oedipus]
MVPTVFGPGAGDVLTWPRRESSRPASAALRGAHLRAVSSLLLVRPPLCSLQLQEEKEARRRSPWTPRAYSRPGAAPAGSASPAARQSLSYPLRPFPAAPRCAALRSAPCPPIPAGAQPGAAGAAPRCGHRALGPRSSGVSPQGTFRGPEGASCLRGNGAA